MNQRLFWLAAGTQGTAVAALFVILLLAPLPEDFFEDYGFVTGPVAWALAAAVTWRILELPLPLVAIAAAAAGVVGAILGFAVTHALGLVAGVVVFGAACAGYDADDVTRAESAG